MSRPRLDEAFSRSPHVVGRTIGGEYVLVPVDGRGADVDSVGRLNPVAAFVWESLDGVRTGERVVDAVVGRFEVDRGRAEADYLELMEALLAARAVEAARPHR